MSVAQENIWVWEEDGNIKRFEGTSLEISATLYWNPTGGGMAVAIFCIVPLSSWTSACSGNGDWTLFLRKSILSVTSKLARKQTC